jgi:alpha-tubulin suppressor-like RCC1 family protein
MVRFTCFWLWLLGLASCVDTRLEESGEIACHDYRDNDSDGASDCLDADCAGLVSCEPPKRDFCKPLTNESPPTFAVSEQSACSIEGGKLYCWGAAFDDSPDRQAAVQVGKKSDWVTLAVGKRHACAIDLVGDLYCWGNDDHGQLGLAGRGSFQPEATRVDSPVQFREVAVGDAHSCALTMANELLCWGSNEQGQLGQGDPELDELSSPTRVLHSRHWLRLALGPEQSCAIDEMSELYCWGHWQAGNEKNAWAPHAWFAKLCMREVATSSDFACFISYSLGSDDDGVGPEDLLSCFGQNERGQLGDRKPYGGSWSSSYGLELNVQRLLTLTTGSRYGCALGGQSKQQPGKGLLVCWGDNPQGQRGSQETEPHPSIVSANWREVHAGGASTCARDDQGTLFCTGDNRRGQCGSAGATVITELTPVQGLPTDKTALRSAR